ncbi:TetR/AcrR family transcriptional regulator [Actinomadura opuntiae]|uniref:TetR/AcrR family transcriptional regulator n=1 Tax=Actinomadura sp. OS1-43 TaxID=604315 RepID=UPI00255ABCAD|nr:TetR/AcrR family transcriptional regulator [Actinomadura sp. OS1-43]MDL4819964.1 TetR/AcrR family transcriptional regulator [Actinomadura sp. OS1-43]
MPKLWNETIEAHRNAVREATLRTTAALVAEHGLAAVTMSRIAKETGIGRATLYKYFPDVEAILVAWHDQQVGGHLERLAAARDRAGTPAERLAEVLRTYAVTTHERPHGTEMAALVHRGGRMADAERRLRELVVGLLADAARDGAVRADVPPDELAVFCLHALGAAGALPSRDAVERLVAVTLDAVRAPG